MSDFTADALAGQLTTRRLGRSALFYTSVGSTNDIAHDEAARGAGDGLVVVAEVQTAGRGRLERTWWAPSGTCLLMSLLLRPRLSLRLAGQLTMCLGLGAVEAIEGVAGAPARLKWPNDLLLHDRKLGGMLSELRTSGDAIEYAVLGLGLNVNLPTEVLPAPLSDTATSLLIETGREVDRTTLLARLLERTENWCGALMAGQPVHHAWAARLDTLGRRVRISGGAGDLEGVAIGVTPEGALIVRDAGGREHTVWSGDVTSVRPIAGEDAQR